ncbi:MAG: DUF3761 domain-containing protein [Proteobacteria bacterium]|nr:DUF3761 domain-containing protein [Pseudomonadota bacterium]
MKHPILLSLISLALSATLPAMAQTAAPAGSTGQCKDGSYTSASFKMGACRGHKGVQSWFGATEAKPAKPAKSATAAAKPAATPASAAAPVATSTAGATGLCKDGTSTNAASKSGACRGHKGVQTWYGSTATTTKPVAAPAPAPAAAPARPAPVATTAPAPAAAPAARTPRTMPAPGPVAAGGGNGQVWVNMKTKVYHCQGDRWYGTSKDGQYMSESAATAAGARASRGKTCGAK